MGVSEQAGLYFTTHFVYVANAMSEINLNGKVAVITGASKGLGKAMALALGGAGASVALVSRDIEKLSEVKQALEKLGGTARTARGPDSRQIHPRGCRFRRGCEDRIGRHPDTVARDKR